MSAYVRRNSPGGESNVNRGPIRITNPSTQQFEVKNVNVELITKDGKRLEPAYFSELDASRKAMKLLIEEVDGTKSEIREKR